MSFIEPEDDPLQVFGIFLVVVMLVVWWMFH
jgi:uncharacterized protein YjeT (DUF2065 family)